jgi:hypothetical protein
MGVQPAGLSELDYVRDSVYVHQVWYEPEGQE